MMKSFAAQIGNLLSDFFKILFCRIDQSTSISPKEATDQFNSLNEVSVTKSWNMML